MSLPITHTKFTPLALAEWLKVAKNRKGSDRRAKAIFIHSQMQIAVDRYKGEGRVAWDYSSNVETTWQIAVKWLEDMARQYGHRNPKLNLGSCENCLFIGAIYHVESDPDA